MIDVPFKDEYRGVGARMDSDLEEFFSLFLNHTGNSANIALLLLAHQEKMLIKIEPGQDYLLDGKTKVKVLKPVNRSQTIFNIETNGQRVESVEAERLKPLMEVKVA